MSSCSSQSSAQEHKPGRLSYQHRPLDHPRKEIRLLEVLPGSGEEPLRANFVCEYLSGDHISPYETISYAWGDSKLRGEIEIDGSVIDIPASSAAALRCMRRPDVSRRLWIDAVCIKQDDIPERNFQVTMMGEVYRRSSHNLVYLGEEDASTQSAIASIGRALEELDTRPGTLENFPDVFNRGGLPLKCEVDLAAVAHFFERPWFSRMWVVQEVVFAPISTCYCGTEICINLLDLVWACLYIYGFHASRFMGAWSQGAFELPSLWSCAQLWPFLEPKGHRYVGLNEDGSMIPGNSGCLQLMELGRHRLCADSRDKVFSIVGLIDQARARTPLEDGADRALLEVDYRKPFEHVYRDAIRFCIQDSQNLEVWRYMRRDYSSKSGDLLLDGFCSWVPRNDLQLDHSGSPHPFIDFRACAGLSVRCDTMTTTVDPNVLALDGYAVAHVTEVSQPLEANLFTNTARLADTLTTIHRMCCGVESSGPTRPNGFPEVLAHTLTLSPYEKSDSSVDIISSMQKHVYSVVDGDIKNEESKYWSEEVRSTFIRACQDRRVFTSSDGNIGQGPGCLRAGDRIVVLLGAWAPFAVRPLSGGDGASGEQFHVLGSVYVHGAMYGECVDAAKACGKEPSTFHFV